MIAHLHLRSVNRRLALELLLRVLVAGLVAVAIFGLLPAIAQAAG